MRVAILTFLMVFSQFSFAQWREDWPDIRKAGQLFTVTLTPGDNSVVVKVAGNKAADFQWDDAGLKVFLVTGKKRQSMQVEKAVNTFVIRDQIPAHSQLQLEVSSKGKKENIDVHVR